MKGHGAPELPAGLAKASGGVTESAQLLPLPDPAPLTLLKVLILGTLPETLLYADVQLSLLPGSQVCRARHSVSAAAAAAGKTILPSPRSFPFPVSHSLIILPPHLTSF